MLCCNRRKAVPGEAVTLSPPLPTFQGQPGIFPAGPATLTGALLITPPALRATLRRRRFGTGLTLVLAHRRVFRRRRRFVTVLPPVRGMQLIARLLLIRGPTLALIRGPRLAARPLCALRVLTTIRDAFWHSTPGTGTGGAIIIGAVTGAVGGTTAG